MKARLIRSEAGGQNLPLVALVILVLFGIVGLSVDVDRTYAEQRNTVRATDAASLASCYPITIRGDSFVNPDGFYSDEIYQNKPFKRIYMKDDQNPNGGFAWVRWKAEQNRGNLPELIKMLTGPGNIREGFDEAPWPPSNDLNLTQPAGYPLDKHKLTPGDWVYGNSGNSAVQNATDVRAALDWHILNRTVMILPFHDTDDGQGINGNYHIAVLGSFLLLGYNLNGPGYFDLVSVGGAIDC